MHSCNSKLLRKGEAEALNSDFAKESGLHGCDDNCGNIGLKQDSHLPIKIKHMKLFEKCK